MSVYSQYSSDDSLSPSGMECSYGARFRGGESWAVGTSSVSWLLYPVAMWCILWHIPKVLIRAFRDDCLWSQDICMLQWWCRLKEVKSLTRWWLWWACWVGYLLCRYGASLSNVGEIQLVDRWVLDLFTSRYLELFHCEVSHHGTSVKV